MMRSILTGCRLCGSNTLGCRAVSADYLECMNSVEDSQVRAMNLRFVGETERGGRLYRSQDSITVAESPSKRPAMPQASAAESATDFGGPVLVRMADVQPEPIVWLWPNRIARGKLTLFCGDPGLGKSLATIDIASRVTNGTGWPDGAAACESGGVILLSAEDDAADTIRPRLDAAGANVARVQLLRAVRRSGESSEAHFCLDGDLPALETAIAQTPDARLVVIDPVSAYLGGRVDSHTNAEVRSLLAPLGQIAARQRVAMLLVTHLSKGAGGKAVYRAMGSLAFVAAARSAWLFAADPADPKRRLFLSAKSNIAPDTAGLAYTTEPGNGGPVIAWHADAVTMTADQALADAERGNAEPNAIDAATEWLRESLAAGPMPADDVQAGAKAESFSRRTLTRAKAALGVKSTRQGFGNGSRWVWSLPKTATPDGESVPVESSEPGGEGGE